MRPTLLTAFLIGACLPVFSFCAVAPSHESDFDQEPVTVVIKEQIGSGAFSTVFRAELEGKPVALKVIHKVRLPEEGETEDEEVAPWTKPQLESIATEVSILDTLFSSKQDNKDPALLLNSYGTFEDDNNFYMLMELGLCDVYELLEAFYPLPPFAVQSIMVDVVRCVAALHEANVMVRDIKCENIIIGQQGQAMLVDFNLAKNDGTLECSERRGSADYMAIELADIENFPTYTHKVDSWAIGCVMFMLAANELPFDTGSLESPVQLAKLKKILEDGMVDVRAVTRFDPRMTTAVRACLRKDPKARPSAKELLEYPYFKDATKGDLKRGRQWLLEHSQREMDDDSREKLEAFTAFMMHQVDEKSRQEFDEAMPKATPKAPTQVVLGGEK